MFTIVNEQSKQSSSSGDLGVVHLDNATLFSSDEPYAWLQALDAESHVRHPTVSVYLHVESFYNFRMKVLSAFRDFPDRVNRRNAMDLVEPVSFDEFLNFTVDNAATCASQVLTALQQYLNFMRISNYDANKNSQV